MLNNTEFERNQYFGIHRFMCLFSDMPFWKNFCFTKRLTLDLCIIEIFRVSSEIYRCSTFFFISMKTFLAFCLGTFCNICILPKLKSCNFYFVFWAGGNKLFLTECHVVLQICLILLYFTLYFYTSICSAFKSAHILSLVLVWIEFGVMDFLKAILILSINCFNIFR